MKITKLPFRELAIYQNKKGTYILFYLHKFDEKKVMQRILWTSNPQGKWNEFGLTSNNLFNDTLYEDIDVVPLGVEVTEDTEALWLRWFLNTGAMLRKEGII